VSVSIGKNHAGRQRRPIDPINSGAGNLNQLQALRCSRHLGCQPHRHQHVDLRQLREDVGFGCDDDLARNHQMAADRLFEAGGKRSGKGDTKHGNCSRGVDAGTFGAASYRLNSLSGN
jgi:hypothetical protein